MIPLEHRELFATFSVTNYLTACLQGRFAALNILSQLAFPQLNTDEITNTRKDLDRVAEWTAGMWKGTVRLAFFPEAERSFEAMAALELLRQAKVDITRFVSAVREALATEVRIDAPVTIDAVRFLVAAFGRAAYARDNYIRGFIEYGKAVKRPDIIEYYEAHLASALEEVRATHEMLSALRDAPSIGRGFLDSVWVRCRDLVFIFSTHLHDINQLLVSSPAQLSFEAADFTPVERAAWEECGIGAVLAGYWRAYEFTPEQARPWCAANLNEAAFASEWRWHGFDFAGAAPWLSQGLPAGVALRWSQAGFTAEEAKLSIDEGITDPTQVVR